MAREYDFRVVPLEQIDPPTHAMRADMDDRALEELTDDVKRNGVLQPLGVFPINGRMRIIWGHRRFVAAELAGELAVPCRVFANGDVHEEDYKLSENRFREDVNPADEATWFADLLERKCGHEIEQLCALVGATESYINGRLDLLRGDERVLEALRAKSINLAVARELNKGKEPDWVAFWLKDAIDQGATAATVQRWRMARDQQLRLAATNPADVQVDSNAAAPAPIGSVDACGLCLLPDDRHEMEYVLVHRSCLKLHMRQMRATAGAQS